jgi:predicted  nucleic acid-binding Zn-ribbon protein
MKEIIERLKQVNEHDVRLKTVKNDLERLPKELTEKQAPPKALKASIERSRGEITKLKMEADSFELEVKAGEEALKRYASQLNMLRHSKEFQATKRQMDAQRQWNKENEAKYYKVVEQIEALEKEIQKNTEALTEAEKSLAAETERVNKELGELRADYDKLWAEREALAKELPAQELEVYNRVVNSRGQAIAHVTGGICSACFMKIPPQFHNLVLLADQLVCCPSCGRILTAG